jgi:hypothetical protein
VLNVLGPSRFVPSSTSMRRALQGTPRAPRVPLASVVSFARRALQDAPHAPRVPLANLCFFRATCPSGCTTCSKGATRVFLWVKPHKSSIKFGKGAKLSPRFMGPFEIVERKGPMAYRLALPDSLRHMHDVFHVSVLRHYISDPTHVIDMSSLQVCNIPLWRTKKTYSLRTLARK